MALLPFSAGFASEPAPTRQALVGSYFYQGSTFFYRLELVADGTYQYAFTGDVAPERRTHGVWQLRKRMVALVQKGSRPDPASRDVSRRFVVLADGSSWALLPKIFMNSRGGGAVRQAARRESHPAPPNHALQRTGRASGVPLLFHV